MFDSSQLRILIITVEAVSALVIEIVATIELHRMRFSKAFQFSILIDYSVIMMFFLYVLLSDQDPIAVAPLFLASPFYAVALTLTMRWARIR